MTASELIEKLQTFKPDSIVEVDYDGPEGSRRLSLALEVDHDKGPSTALLVGDGSWELDNEDDEDDDDDV